MDFEAKLSEYRNRKRTEYLAEKSKRSFLDMLKLNLDPDSEKLLNDTNTITSDDENADAENASLFSNRRRTLKILFYTTVWVIAFLICVKLQWGAVFFVVSALLFIYFNTRTGPKRAGEVSAYSVFNRDCKTIDGTLTAEQFEKELRYGPGTV